MNDLSALHNGLRRVKRFRQGVRNGSALSMFLAPVLWALLVAMALDVVVDMGKLERGVTFLIVAGVVVWSVRKFLLPMSDFEESDVETAMLVERQHGMETDLVAAMQFADGNREQFGSSELRAETINNAEKSTPGLDYLEGFSREELKRKLGIFLVSAGVFVVVMVAFPGHARAFFSRFFLGNAHYPTRTIIAEIVSPGAKVPFGVSVTFDVRADGELPEKGRVKIRTSSGGLTTEVELLPDAGDPKRYVGKLARAMDDFSYQVLLGDAYTDLQLVKLTPLAVVAVDFEIETPAYASAELSRKAMSRSARLTLEGSRVVPFVTADKPLKSVTFSVDDKPWPMTREGDRFVLKGADSPLAHVDTTFRWQVQVLDEDDLSLERPVSGVLQVRPDMPPNVGIATVSRLVWSGANPTIQYKAVDDYALEKVVLHLAVQRLGEGSSDTSGDKPVEIASAANHESEIKGTFVLDVGKLEVTKGDRIFVSFEAFDFRGKLPGQSMRGEQLVLEVSDREGVLEALRDSDEQIEKKLDQIIDAQLDI